MKILSQARFLRTVVVSMACAITTMPSQSLTAQTIPRYDPPPPIDPTIRGGNCSTVVPEILSPVSKKVITTSAYPTFLFFVPTTTARQVQFSLRDRDRKSIYRQTFALSGQAGILRVVLPTEPNTKELALGQSYRWEFSIICNPENRKVDDFVVGELQRVALVDAKAPSQMTLWERYRAFEYDALMVLDLLRRSNPSDRLIQSEWEAWLVRHKMGDVKLLPAIALKSQK